MASAIGQVVPLEKWLEKARRLLEQEHQEEIRAARDDLESVEDSLNPNVLSHLQLVQWSTALFGRKLLKLAFPSVHLRLAKPHQFTVGDLVQLRLKSVNSKNAKLPTGIVAKVDETSISIAMDPDQELEEEELSAGGQKNQLTLDRLVNNATFLKIDSALGKLSKFDYGAAQPVIQVVFNGQPPQWNLPLPSIEPFNNGLNAGQIEAIRFALASKDLALIHGPPGTGKTTTVVELIQQAVRKYHMKVLLCAPSNIAVDNVLEKLAQADPKLQLTRIGHPARLLPSVLTHCLDNRIAQADGTQIVDDIHQETAQLEHQLRKKSTDKSTRYMIRQQLKANRKEIRQREIQVVSQLLQHSDVVFATNVGASSKLLKDLQFDLVVIDEAAQAIEASCWIPITKAPRCVLAGDHCQLPPTIVSKQAAREGLDVTLFDRMTKRFEADVNSRQAVQMLKVQYRMHENICNWSSEAMYQRELRSHESVASRRLHELPHVAKAKSKEGADEMTNATLLLIDTAGCGVEEDEVAADDVKSMRVSQLALSKSNEGEARLVVAHVKRLLAIGLHQEEIAVITPYNKQVQLIKGELANDFPKLEIRSVDGFQGCEKEAVVMSLVRSNDRKEVGFLADERRMNVAVTRAKRHVALICDSETISSNAFLKQMVDYFEENGEVHSAQEFLNEEMVTGDSSTVDIISEKRTAPATTRKTDASTQPPASPLRLTSATPPNAPKNRNQKQRPSVQAESKEPVNTSVEQQPKQPQLLLADVDNEEEEQEKEEVEEKPIARPNGFAAFSMSSESSASESEQEDDKEQEIDDDEAEPDAAASASKADDDLDEAGALLRQLHLERLARQKASQNDVSESSKNAKSKKKKNKKRKPAAKASSMLEDNTKPKPSQEPLDPEDEMAFLEQAAKASTKCSLQLGSRKCSKSTTMFGSVCGCCKLKFCYEHSLPEVHGCGQAIRDKCRQEATSRSTSWVSTGSQKLLSKEKRSLIKQKLDQKVAQQTASRQTAKKSSKKKK